MTRAVPIATRTDFIVEAVQSSPGEWRLRRREGADVSWSLWGYPSAESAKDDYWSKPLDGIEYVEFEAVGEVV